MKQVVVMFGLVMALNASASVEHTYEKNSQPTETEIQMNRSCFSDLEVQGCGDAGEDPEHFRSCMANVHQNLNDHCQKLMSKLYGTK